MPVKPANLLIIMSDEHSPKMLGCYGHPLVATPNLDSLARRGTRFASAYTTSPVCIPARAAFACGKYIHQIGFWDNADPYDGSVPSWHHRLRDLGHRVVSIGKLHFRSTADDNGFSEEIAPMHVVEGKGDLMGLVRSDLPVRKGAYKMANLAGPGESSYTFYDRDIAARAQVWLREEAPKWKDTRWILFVSFVCPHFPLTAPPEFFYPYYNDPKLPRPKQYDRSERPNHPYLVDYRGSFNYDDYFDEDKLRRAIAGYYGLCSFLDDNIGKLVRTLEDTGLAESTRVLYTSDHGDNLGARGCWGKSTLFEETAGVPLIIAGPDIPQARTIDTPASHVDAYPFIMQAVGADRPEMYDGQPGMSLFDLASGVVPERNVVSEYHGMGSTTGAFMIRHGRFKYIRYVRYPAQLFDLDADPEELNDLARDPRYAAVLAECGARLRRICDPEEVDARAKHRQAKLLEAYGGRDAVIRRGDLGFTPAPGVPVAFD
jgi:choline-sulfatase